MARTWPGLKSLPLDIPRPLPVDLPRTWFEVGGDEVDKGDNGVANSADLGRPLLCGTGEVEDCLMNGLLRTVPMMHWLGPQDSGLKGPVGGQGVEVEEVFNAGLREQLKGMFHENREDIKQVEVQTTDIQMQ